MVRHRLLSRFVDYSNRDWSFRVIDVNRGRSSILSLTFAPAKKQPQQKRMSPKSNKTFQGQVHQNSNQQNMASGGTKDGAEALQSPEPQAQKVRSQPRHQSRDLGIIQAQDSDDACIVGSDLASTEGRRNRNRNSNRTRQKDSGARQLVAVNEVGETVDGVTSGGTDLVRNTAGNAVNRGADLAGRTGDGLKEGNDQDDGDDEHLRLTLDLNLDVEVQLKASIHGDLTLGLLYAFPSFFFQ